MTAALPGPAMTLAVAALLAAVTFGIGYAFALLTSRSRTAGMVERNRALEQNLAGAQASITQQNEELRRLTEARSAAEARLDEERKKTQEKAQLLADAG